MKFFTLFFALSSLFAVEEDSIDHLKILPKEETPQIIEEDQSRLLFGVHTALPDKLLKIMLQEKYEHSTWGLYVKDLISGKVIFDLNSNDLFLPASTSKIASASALLHSLGPNYCFHTPVFASGKIEKGILRGDLILVGQGDLTLGGRQSGSDKISYTKMDHSVANEVPGAILTKEDPLNGLNALAKQIYDSGIKKVIGDVQIDDSLFETTNKRGMVLSPVMINENLIDIIINPTSLDQNAQVELRPEVPGYTFENQVVTIENEGELNINVTREEEKIIVQGTIPLTKKNIVRTLAVQNPKAFAKAAFIKALKNQGVQIDNRSKSQKLNSLQNLTQVAVWESPPLTEYVKLILKVSHNSGANLIPLLLATYHGKKTFEEGMKMIGDFLIQEVKLLPDTFVMSDAAGGNENRFTPQAEVQLLEFMKKQKFIDFKRFLEAFPILGVDGSMEDFGKDTLAVGKVWTKPGTGVVLNLATDHLFLMTQALAGYIEGKNGHLFAYMLVVNNAKMPEMNDVQAIFEDESQISSILYEHTEVVQ